MTTLLWLAVLASVVGAGGLAHMWRVERVEREALDEGIRLGRALGNLSPEVGRSLTAEALEFARWSRERAARARERSTPRGRW